MEVKFFTSEITRKKIKNIYENIEKLSPESEFEQNKLTYLKLLLSSFLSEPIAWDKNTPLNTEKIGDSLASTEITKEFSEQDIDNLYSDCFRFFIERVITEDVQPTGHFSKIREFTLSNKDKFSSLANQQIEYALLAMPMDIVQYRFNGEHINLTRLLIDKYEHHEQMQTAWENELEQKERRVKALSDTLEKQEDAFNFVGLHKGFRKLGAMKKLELRAASRTMKTLGWVSLIPIAIEIIVVVRNNGTMNLSNALVSAIPATSLLLILIYFFRIALQDYRSIKAQINQIELRKSLCMFIQGYVKYAKEMKTSDNSTLDKFENIIFSNIVMSDEKLPSTFDGLDSIASIVKEIKGK
ncbi:hypothetical protein I5N09_09995 [Serratia marcescens]|uniref:hypothetical protein n=1 Tax=Serratia marcescens TaxID=615 RepID=UPI000CDCE6EE|nr:hypothetical protein [Serratia marcescens]MBH3099282.1 hypothetical protein [Serratia marcescens]MBH3218347.1 hypothetical protein [Serratia marcescens]POW84390.1 hypothetical protein C3461_23965 [Serratia marcescens]POW89125.1 hypothetical protein C3459_23950 [Serratia marcescens]POX03269.1 hypothetical protein C3458_23975 [Serratia marcescens]